MSTGAWVYENFDIASGISFLPYSGHTYRQAPYQPISKDEYEEWVTKMPKAVEWSRISEYEKEDMTTASHELACTGNSCEIV
jgi:ribonucleoside-diphosphate reductase alpha chain